MLGAMPLTHPHMHLAVPRHADDGGDGASCCDRRRIPVQSMRTATGSCPGTAAR